jgi:acetylornithine/succinyldiaminopimelate/putrescine aminotransferase
MSSVFLPAALDSCAALRCSCCFYQQIFPCFRSFKPLQTTNPRALDVATEVLKACTPAVRDNIKTRGKELQQKMLTLCAKHPAILKTVTGNGLLQAVHLQPDVAMFGGNQSGTVSFLAQCRKGSFLLQRS